MPIESQIMHPLVLVGLGTDVGEGLGLGVGIGIRTIKQRLQRRGT